LSGVTVTVTVSRKKRGEKARLDANDDRVVVESDISSSFSVRVRARVCERRKK